MYNLGFNVIKWADEFSIKDFILKLEFFIGDKKHELIRHSDTFILDRKEVYLSESEFKEAFNSLFDIEIKLNLRQGDLIASPYPTDVLLFHYVDQDSSYNNLFNGNLKSLQMYKYEEVYRVYKYLLGIEDYEIADLRNKKAKNKTK